MCFLGKDIGDIRSEADRHNDLSYLIGYGPYIPDVFNSKPHAIPPVPTSLTVGINLAGACLIIFSIFVNLIINFWFQS